MEKPGKPTIHELEQILSEPGGAVEVLPDGSVVVNEELTMLRARVVQLENPPCIACTDDGKTKALCHKCRADCAVARVAELELSLTVLESTKKAPDDFTVFDPREVETENVRLQARVAELEHRLSATGHVIEGLQKSEAFWIDAAERLRLASPVVLCATCGDSIKPVKEGE